MPDRRLAIEPFRRYGQALSCGCRDDEEEDEW
jgi:hypothetical protein